MAKKLTKRQIAVIDELFSGEQTIEQILEKNGVNRKLYDKWHIEPAFAEAFEQQVQQLGRHSRLLIAKYSSLAAAKLIALTDSANPETARKACLDIIDRIQNSEHRIQNEEVLEQDDDAVSISPQLAEKILESLAQDKTSDSI